jgi:hypothetical protein
MSRRPAAARRLINSSFVAVGWAALAARTKTLVPATTSRLAMKSLGLLQSNSLAVRFSGINERDATTSSGAANSRPRPRPRLVPRLVLLSYAPLSSIRCRERDFSRRRHAPKAPQRRQLLAETESRLKESREMAAKTAFRPAGFDAGVSVDCLVGAPGLEPGTRCDTRLCQGTNTILQEQIFGLLSSRRHSAAEADGGGFGLV